MSMARAWVLIGSIGLFGCGGDKDDAPPDDTDTEDTDPPVPTGDSTPEPPGPDMVFTDVNNYTYEATWTLQSAPIRSEFDVVVTWGDLTTDAWGTKRDASSYDRLLLFEAAAMDAKEFVRRLGNDDLGPTEITSLWEADVDGTVFASLSDLEFEKTAFVPENFLFEQASKTWVLALADVVGERLDVRTALIVVPTDLDPAVQAELVDGSGALTWSASFSGTPLQTAEVHDTYSLDWSDLINDVHGVEYDRFQTTELFIGRWDAGAPDPLAVHDLRSTADAWWTMDTAGRDDALLELARDDASVNFAGFTAGSTWMIGERCLDCLGPAPLWLTEVDVW